MHDGPMLEESGGVGRASPGVVDPTPLRALRSLLRPEPPVAAVLVPLVPTAVVGRDCFLGLELRTKPEACHCFRVK